MTLTVKVGSVFRYGTWGDDTYFDADEEYETEAQNIEDATSNLESQYNGVYNIYETLEGIVACVY